MILPATIPIPDKDRLLIYETKPLYLVHKVDSRHTTGAVRTSENPSDRSSRGPYRAGLLARLEALGPQHAELERQAGEGLPRGVATEPRPPLFGYPGSGLCPRLLLREGVPEFREGGVRVPRFHDLILA